MAQSYFQIILSDGTTPLTLTSNPAGIKDFKITYKRHALYGTVMRSISESLRFVKEGAAYIKDLFDSHGIDAECSIIIKTINLTNKTYSTVYEAVLDFSTYKSDSDFVEIALISSSESELLASRENVEIDLTASEDLDGNTLTGLPTQDTLQLSPVDLIYWAVPETANIGYLFTSPPGTNPLEIYPSLYNVENFIGADFDESNGQYHNTSGSAKNILFDYSILLGLSGSFGLSSGVAGDQIVIEFDVYRRGDSSLIYHFDDTYQIPLGSTSGSKSTSFSQLIADSDLDEIADGDYQGIYVDFTLGYSGGATPYLNFNLSGSFTKYEMTLVDESPLAATDCYAFKPLDAIKRAFKIMGITTVPSSTVFGSGGDFELCYLTTGKRIREFGSTEPFNISFRDLFAALSNIFGIWMNESFQFEKHATFLSNTTGLIITKYSNLEYSVANDLYLNSIKIGYENQDYNESNGLIEYNTEFEFATVNKTDKKVDKISGIRADGLGIEYTRRKNSSTTGTEDTDADNDVFIISCVNDAGTLRPEIGSDFTTVTGLRNSDQYYNLFLTPKRNLIRNGLLLNTSLYHKTKEVKYLKSKNKINLEVDGINELDSDYLTASSKTLKPVLLSFDTILSSQVLLFLKNFNYTKISVAGETGYLEQAEINLYKKTASMKIILV